MFSEKILAHFRDPHNAGELSGATHIAEVTNPVCGDVLRLSVRVEEDKVAAASFKAQGCVPAIAAGSAITDMLKGKSLVEARQITAGQIAAELGGLPEASRHAAELCCDAIAALKPSP
jgi:nitrogen fixation NifU-like protein